MKLKRLLGAENGWGGAIGTLLLLGFGLFVLLVNVAELREASRVKPEERGCTEWLANPSGAKWVTLIGCKLDLAVAASPKWKGSRAIPLFVGDPMTPPRAVLATSDTELLAVVDGAAQLGSPEEAAAFLQSHAAPPKSLTGYVEPAKSVAALQGLAADDAVVLKQGQQPQRLQTLFGMLVGLVAVALVVRSMFMRYLVDRDSSL